jgi:hypothetical protein
MYVTRMFESEPYFFIFLCEKTNSCWKNWWTINVHIDLSYIFWGCFFGSIPIYSYLFLSISIYLYIYIYLYPYIYLHLWSREPPGKIRPSFYGRKVRGFFCFVGPRLGAEHLVRAAESVVVGCWWVVVIGTRGVP